MHRGVLQYKRLPVVKTSHCSRHALLIADDNVWPQERPAVRLKIGEMNTTLALLHDRVLAAIWTACDASRQQEMML